MTFFGYRQQNKHSFLQSRSFQHNYFNRKIGVFDGKPWFNNDRHEAFDLGKFKCFFNSNSVKFKTGQIGNKVWLDANGNGIFDQGEEGVEGVKVTLSGAGRDGIFGTSDDITKVRTTNHNGHYKFKNLAAGDYKVSFSDLPSDLKFTTPNVGDQEWKDSDVINPSTGMTDVITLKAGQSNNKIDAGLVQVTPSQSEPVSILEDGTYMLSNHEDGTSFGNGNPHGLILTGLFVDGMYQTGDISVFDFEHPDANMRMSINGDEIRIFGTAFGHLDVDDNFDYNDNDPGGLWQIDFSYNNADNVSGDDDISIDAQFAGLNTGSIKQLYGDQVEFDLSDEAGSNSFSFQVGDKTDNQGHRGFEGISGWGWLNHSNADEYVYHSDWLFTVDPEELINEGPSFSNIPQNGILSIMENAPNVIDISSTDDFDGEGRGLKYSIVGGPDQDLFNIDQDTGELSFKYAPNFENPLDHDSDNNYKLKVRATDLDGAFTDKGLSVMVNDDTTEIPPILEDGTYQLSNHPDGTDFGNGNPHGLILTGLFVDGMYQTGDISVFDFEHPDANMRMSVDGNEIRIFGTAFGNLDVDNNFDYDDTPGLWQIDFSYNNVETLTGDDDLSVNERFSGINTGSIKQLYGNQAEFDLSDEAGNNSFSFQVGDKTDNQGHRGFEGISGWGWLNHSNADQYVYHSDWLFTVDPEELINEGPSFTNLPQNGVLSIMEDSINVIDINATDDFDGEGRGLQYSIVGGQDQDLFNIDQDTGELSFKDAPDFQNPLDHDSDNKYNLKLQVTDLDGAFTDKDLSVMVENPNPVPNSGTIVGSSSITEGSNAHYQVKLDGVVHEDTFVTIKINNGTANLADEFRLDRVDYLSNPVTENVQLGEEGQLYTATLSDRNNAFYWWNEGYTGFSGDLDELPVGVNSLTDDFQVSGAEGNHLVVKIDAGSDTSNSFTIDALKEIQFGKYFSRITATEATENFSLTIDQIGDNDVNTGHKTIEIIDNYAVYSPIAFDLNRDGIQTLSIDEGVKFDMLNTGTAVNTGWLSGEDGFLAIDKDGDGLISSRDELFGGGVGDGFAKLETFDSNGDGLVNQNDAHFGELKLWQDSNENGITDQGELVSLDSTGITDLNTDYTNVFSTDAMGNIHGEHSNALLNGNTIDMVDVYFQVEL